MGSSRHTKLVGTLIYEALHLIIGCLVPTPVDMFLVLAGIVPSHIKHNHAVLKLAGKSFQSNPLVMYQLSDYTEKPSPR